LNITKLIKQALDSVEKEIDAVREKPSSDTLINGVRERGSEEYIYLFETQNKGLRFAEELTAFLEGKEYEASVVEFKEQQVRISFESNMGEQIDELYLEWENDFVLKKIKAELEMLADKKIPTQLKALFNPDAHFNSYRHKITVKTDKQRNESQNEAIHKSLDNNILFVWGPPGTGKTSTVGYIVANYLRLGKSVLFVSNTNRAVDVGLLNVMDALDHIQPGFDHNKITRFGEAALHNEQLEQVLFEQQVGERLKRRKEEAVELSSTLSKYEQLQAEIDQLMDEGKEVPEALDLQINLLGEKLDRRGGTEKVEEEIDKLLNINERYELKKKQLVATTLAKVCTSDLFYERYFDAVVVDEASMAGLHYMLIMASKSDDHLVVVGDPMQLPPIAVTNNPDAREFLESDIFTTVSGATKPEDLFSWHDEHPEFTCFFDTQYRLNSDLAGVISTIFYDSRLVTTDDKKLEKDAAATVALIDTSKYSPFIVQGTGEGGFKPMNETHLRFVEESIRRLSKKHPTDQIGVIVPFRHCVWQTRKHLFSQGLNDIEVGTIHTFQGREKEVIIFDTVMSGQRQGRSERHFSVRPFDETKNGLSVPRLLNVAFSRSKEMLVIIADMNHVERVYGNKFLGKLLRSIREISL